LGVDAVCLVLEEWQKQRMHSPGREFVAALCVEKPPYQGGNALDSQIKPNMSARKDSSENSSTAAGSIAADSASLRDRSLETDSLLDMDVDVESSHSPGRESQFQGCFPTTPSRDGSFYSIYSFLSKSSYSEIIAYVGVRGVVLLVALKVIGILLVGMLLLQSSSHSSGFMGDGISSVSLVAAGRPSNLRELIRLTTRSALGKATSRDEIPNDQRNINNYFIEEQKYGNKEPPLLTMPTANDLVYDHYIEVSCQLLSPP
jgi:hypothetical protein